MFFKKKDDDNCVIKFDKDGKIVSFGDRCKAKEFQEKFDRIKKVLEGGE